MSIVEGEDEWNYYLQFDIHLHGMQGDNYVYNVHFRIGLARFKGAGVVQSV